MKKLTFALLTAFALASCAYAAMSDDDFLTLCRTGDAEKIAAELKNGANPNATAKKGDTALIKATQSDKPEAVKVLLESGANNINAGDWDNRTALIWAAIRGNAQTAALLLDAGADPNAIADGDTTALGIARNAEVAQLLLDRGAKAENGRPTTPLMDASARNENGDVVALLIKAGANVNAANKQGNTPLMFAAANGRLGAMRALLAAGAEINAVNNMGYTALASCLGRTSPDAALLLLQHGAAKTPAGDEPLTEAVERNRRMSAEDKARLLAALQ